MIDEMNARKPLCPVLYVPLLFAKGDEPLDCDHSLNTCDRLLVKKNVVHQRRRACNEAWN